MSDKQALTKILFVGFGDIAARAAAELASGEFACFGLRRSQFQAPSNVVAITADVTLPDSLKILQKESFDIVVISLTPVVRSASAYHEIYINGLGHVLAELRYWRPSLLLFASSTSVYPQIHGELVDETATLAPAEFAGKILLEAEHLLQNTSLASTVIRFGGIYGPGRDYLLKQVASGQIAADTPIQYTNRIHSQDCGRVIAHLVRRHLAGDMLPDIINAVDCNPAPLHEVVNWLRQQQELTAENVTGPLLQRRGSKRVLNQRLLATGFEFLYPDYRHGYAEQLRAWR